METVASEISFDPLVGENAPGKPFEESYWTTRTTPERTGTLLTSAISLAATCVGTGLFALPYAFATAGAGLGAFILSCCAAISVFMSYALCQCSDWARCYSYEEIMVAAFGRSGAFLMETVVVWLLLGAMTSALVVVGDTLSFLFLSMGLATPGLWRSVLVAADLVFVALPLSWVQTTSSLRHSNTVAVICTVFVAALLMARGVTCGGELWESLSKRPPLNFTVQTLQVVPIMMLSLGCQVQVPGVYGELRERSLSRMTRALASAGMCCFSLYVGVAIFGVLAVDGCGHSSGDHGTSIAGVSGNVLDSLPSNDWCALAMRVIIAMTLTLVYPMLCLPCRSTIDHICFGGGGSTRGTTVRHAVETISIASLTLLFSEYDHNLASVFSFTGATAGALICYVLPPICYIRLRRGQSLSVQSATRWQSFFSYVLLLCIAPLMVTLRLQAYERLR